AAAGTNSSSERNVGSQAAIIYTASHFRKNLGSTGFARGVCGKLGQAECIDSASKKSIFCVADRPAFSDIYFIRTAYSHVAAYPGRACTDAAIPVFPPYRLRHPTSRTLATARQLLPIGVAYSRILRRSIHAL